MYAAINALAQGLTVNNAEEIYSSRKSEPKPRCEGSQLIIDLDACESSRIVANTNVDQERRQVNILQRIRLDGIEESPGSYTSLAAESSVGDKQLLLKLPTSAGPPKAGNVYPEAAGMAPVFLLPGQSVPQRLLLLPFLSLGNRKCPLCAVSFSCVDELNEHVFHAQCAPSRITTPSEIRSANAESPRKSQNVPSDATTTSIRECRAPNRNKRGYECEECHKRFSQRGHLLTHLRVHSGERPYECELCHKRFSQTGHLVSHMNSHTNNRPYECRYCRRRFTQSGHMRNHERLHLGLRPYQCGQCSKSFTQSGHLINHMRLHEGIKPFSCSSCGQRFTQSGHLSNHIRRCNGELTKGELDGEMIIDEIKQENIFTTDNSNTDLWDNSKDSRTVKKERGRSQIPDSRNCNEGRLRGCPDEPYQQGQLNGEMIIDEIKQENIFTMDNSPTEL